MLVSLLALLVLVPAGCSSDSTETSPGPTPSSAPARVVASILIAKNQLTLVGLRPVAPDALPPPRQPEPKVDWRFESETGEILAEGSLTNPLLVTSEFDKGTPAPKTYAAGAAVFEVELPNVGGIFVLSDAALTGGTGPKSWDSIAEALKVFVQKLVDVFDFGSGAGGSAGEGAGGSAGGEPGGGAAGLGAAGGAGGAAGAGAVIDGVGPNEQLVQAKAGCEAFTLLFVAEGYTEGERAKFDTDVANVVGALSATEGFAEHWDFLSVWQKFFASAESGISDVGTNVQRQTAFSVQHPNDPNDPDMRRAIWMSADVSPERLAELEAAKAAVGADVVLMLANTTDGGGAASPVQRLAIFTTDVEAGPTAGHELGHALFGLEDEYEYGTCNPGAYEPLGPNVALGSPYPWAPMFTKGINIPTVDPDPSVVGVYEGALYCPKGAYRPQSTCFMRTLDSKFCKVCAAHVSKSFLSRTPGCQPKGSCEHSECAAGPALTKGCSACASSVCATHPDCCDPAESWSADCVKVAQGIVGACRGICAVNDGSCAHSECSEGAALTAGCSTCAGSVCERDPYCCDEKWDLICAKEAGEDPFCSCPK